MSIYITGDTHGSFKRFTTYSFPEQKDMSRDDYVIITGDFGGVWHQENSNYVKSENYWLDWLEDKPYTTLFICGNHENFDRLYKYPVKEFNGGLVHEIRPHVLHLMRGEIYDLQGYKFFVFGGASSHDIQDGILNMNEKDKIKLWTKQNKMFRVRGLSWWDLEMPTQEEMQHGIENLRKHNFKVDFVLSHCAPQNVVSFFSHGLYKSDILTTYFDELIEQGLKFNAWVFGHYHDDKKILGKYIMLYEQIVRII